MKKWLESVYSDGSKYFVSNPLPKKAETIKIKIRLIEQEEVKHIFLRTKINGVEKLISMEKDSMVNGLAYYSCEVTIYEDVLHYHFYLVTDHKVYYYTQYNITDYVPEESNDFKILTNYQQPSWVKESVFYQIFPERFCNGNQDNDVRDGEYVFQGHETKQIKDWNTPTKNYDQSFCLDFYGGDLEGVRKKIPYLKELGVNAIYVNPIFQAATVHKYDCVDYFHVDEHFGGDRAFEKLMKELHKNNMKLIVDVSINHTGSASKWFNKEVIFYPESVGAYHNKDAREREFYFFGKNNEYTAWFNEKTLPTLNYNSVELRNILYRNTDSLLKKWMKAPYNIDGWRFDVADTMARNNEVQLHHEVWPEIRKSIKEENEQAYILAEDWSDCKEFLQGDEWDSTMNYFACARPIREFVGETDLFYVGRKELNKIPYKMTARNLHLRITQYLSKLPFVMQEVSFNLLDSHDVSRLHNNENVNYQDYRGAVIMLFTLPGTPSIYYGDEVGIDGRIEVVEGCRYPMSWDKGKQESPNYKLYHTLANLKTSSKALQSGGFKVLSDEDYVFCYARFTLDEVVIIICSTDDFDQEVALPITALGIKEFVIKEDLFGLPLQYEKKGENVVIKVPSHTSYIFTMTANHLNNNSQPFG